MLSVNFVKSSSFRSTSWSVLLDTVQLGVFIRSQTRSRFRAVSYCHCFFKALYFNCRYLISKVTLLYLSAGKCILLIFIKISSLKPFCTKYWQNPQIKLWLFIISRSSHRSCSVQKDVLKKFGNFIGKHQCRSLGP